MILNISSTILKNLLFGDLDTFFNKKYNKPRIAISPIITQCGEMNEFRRSFTLHITSSIKSFTISLYTKNITPIEEDALYKYLNPKIHHTEIIFSMLFKYQYNIKFTRFEIGSNCIINNLEKCKRIDMSIITDDREVLLSILIPDQFIKLFVKRIDSNASTEEIESGIRNYFKNPMNIFPNLKIILESFSDRELQNLLYQLQKNSLLSVYQICLIVFSFPENSLKLKKNLSTNTVRDVTAMMKNLKSHSVIKTRDLVGGIYSIEEAIFFLMRDGADFNYSFFLSKLQKSMDLLSSIEVLLIKDFQQWLIEMKDSGLLYKTLSITNELVIAQSLSDTPDTYYPIIKGHTSERRLNEIRAIIDKEQVSPMDRIYSQARLIANYKRVKMKKLNLGDESFSYLLRRFTQPSDYSNLLFAVGWFVLSTSCKGMEIKRIKNIMSSIPIPARYLIEDVIKGILNPNIFHDEMQIRNARSICVKAIISLYEDGVIHLVE